MNEVDKLYHKKSMTENIKSVTDALDKCRSIVSNNFKNMSDDKIRTLNYRLIDLYIDSTRLHDEVLKDMI